MALQEIALMDMLSAVVSETGLSSYASVTAKQEKDVYKVTGNYNSLKSVFLSLVNIAWHSHPEHGILVIDVISTPTGGDPLISGNVGHVQISFAKDTFLRSGGMERETPTGVGAAGYTMHADICAEIVKNHGGRLVLQQDPMESGIRCTVFLPLAAGCID